MEETLSGKRLLLLEEQAVGDVMQFLTLLPKLIDEADHICLLLNPRLISIYKRSFSDYIQASRLSIASYDDVFSEKLAYSNFDIQSPIGSICRHRFVDINMYGQASPILKSDPNLTQQLRKKYLNKCGTDVEKVIGISWRGGGRPERIKQKSLDAEMFSDLLRDQPGVRFVSLQYGESKATVEKWQSVELT